MLYQTERLEQTELLENKNGDFALKALRNSVISAFDKEIQNKTHQKEKIGKFCIDLNLCVTITPKACISSKRSFVYHQGESLVYHHCERGCSLRLMIYSPCRDILGKADEIHAKAWWDTAQKGLMIYAALCASMICQACGLDKKFDKSTLVVRKDSFARIRYIS